MDELQEEYKVRSLTPADKLMTLKDAYIEKLKAENTDLANQITSLTQKVLTSDHLQIARETIKAQRSRIDSLEQSYSILY